ncbi:FAD:protein FMN transferase, partial [Intestinibacter sp.]|uniref:FAD:protein FMN transferase n=1 Tax=Intestinibacter sp. TaxID=1965304 RepID=UPI003F1415E5
MNRKKSTFLIVAIIVICFFIYVFRGNFNKGDYSQTYYDLGTVSEITLYNVKESEADDILKKCGDILLNIDNTMGKTREYSEISEVNKKAGKEYVKISDETFYVIKNALNFSDISDGVFDITIGPVVDLWGIGTENARVPSSNEIKEKLPLVNYKDISLDEKNKSVKLEKENMEIDLGGIAKGYAADKIYEYLQEQNVESAIINLGGNVFVLGEKDKNTPFKVGIQDPTNERGNSIGSINVSDQSVVTSGIYERYIEKDGVIYHHMIDPSTGYPFDNNLSSVTIVSSSSLIGDGLSTTAFGLGVEKGLELIESIDDTEAIFITKDKNVYTTSNLKDKIN